VPPTTRARETAIDAVDLRKTYPGGRGRPPVHALDGLSFAVPAGTVFALLGPNGAGKSTTAKILTTLSRADSGTATVAGIDVARQPERVRRAIGYVAQKPVTDPTDTGRENLVLAGRLQGLGARAARVRATELLDRFSLADAADRLVKTYSGGMARKLDVAMGIVHRPQVLFLDEPTTGLDPEARAEMWAEIERMTARESMTILLTTHYLEEADRLAANLAIVDHGRVAVAGTPDALKDELRGDGIVVELAPAALGAGSGGPDCGAALASRVTAAVRACAGVRDVHVEGRTLRARADSGAVALPAVLTALDAAGLPVASATLARPSLDDVYLRHTGRTFTAAQSSAPRSDGAPGDDPGSRAGATAEEVAA